LRLRLSEESWPDLACINSRSWRGSSIITSSTNISLIVVNTIQNCIVGMKQVEYNFNSFYRYINANSLFTTRQIDIISRRLAYRGATENMSSGAYYRQVKQCRTKIVRLLYSIILLKCIGALDQKTFFAIEKMASQIEVMLAQNKSDNSRAESVISVIEQLVKRMCKV
jgi:hypothetical protein